MDRDILVLRAVARALDKSSSPRMLRANLEFIYGSYNARPAHQPERPTGGRKNT
jgi:hypothetical protein